MNALPDQLTSVSIGTACDSRLRWAEGGRFLVPRALLDRSGLAPNTDGTIAILPECAAIADDDVSDLRSLAAFTDAPPVSARLPVSYQVIPGWLRSLLASAYGRWQRRRSACWAVFPRWPLDLSADFLADLAGHTSPYAGGPTPVVLSHDLDSPEGLKNVVENFLPMEEAVGARSTNFIVPCAWPIDHGRVSEMHGRGHEIGMHGYDHSNQTAFSSPELRRRRLQQPRDLIERYDIQGYRAPSLLRTRPLLRDLAGMYRYDSSIPTSGGLFPVPNNGCASARPFHIEGIVELPVSMPRDGSLRFLGHTPAEILAIWKRCAEDIARSGGVVVLLTHCEARFSGNPPMRGIYRAFLEFVAGDRRFAWSTPRAVLARYPNQSSS